MNVVNATLSVGHRFKEWESLSTLLSGHFVRYTLLPVWIPFTFGTFSVYITQIQQGAVSISQRFCFLLSCKEPRSIHGADLSLHHTSKVTVQGAERVQVCQKNIPHTSTDLNS